MASRGKFMPKACISNDKIVNVRNLDLLEYSQVVFRYAMIAMAYTGYLTIGEHQ